MREAYHGKEILKDDNGNFYGINLGYDYCAEHEFGLKELEYALGINKDLIGIEGRKQTSKGRYVTCSFTKNKEKWVGLAFVENYYNTFENKKEIKDFILSRVYLCNDKVLTSAWDSKGFEIVVPIKYQYIIDELAQALENNQLVIGIGGSVNPFSRGGLLLMIYDKIPKGIKDAVKEADLDYIELQKVAFKKTKIEKILAKAKKEYYALSPAWTDETKKEVHYWLNPKDQEHVNYGWFTLEDLKLWAKNKGPIPKTK